ncbi:MAG: hypothetical protein US54_C0069G0008 [Candidatus Roizmanbacteria bacterium GW2011_GWA2_37_7]|uniref:DUF1648 domain-containing protein n=1 Tax=Candidatus Roizmanbacteria bacterium GW2011_GWA2_37_7 TaxID=1618481 RepID=A0A0G0H2K8_9BACT|nr:MAG: hypothetical protein US54_C0069G0008 [Candidatus Roizmanbacteria bacterium GW2011_GWA2_37_7]
MTKFLIGANILIATTFAWRFQFLPKQIPLFYSKPWGEPQIADVWYILLLPIFMNLMFFVNNQISNRFFSTQTVIRNIFAFSNGILIVGFMGVFFKILFLVT